MPRVALLLLPSFLLAAPAADAQRLPEIVRELRPEQIIRLQTSDDEHIGRFLRLGGDTVHLDADRGAAAVPLEAVERLWVRGTSARTGAKVGAIAGGVGTAAAFVLLASIGCGLGGQEDCPLLGAAAIGGLIGAGIGALGGVVIGSFIETWHARYP